IPGVRAVLPRTRRHGVGLGAGAGNQPRFCRGQRRTDPASGRNRRRRVVRGQLPDHPPTIARPAVSATAPRSTTPRVLVVDDEPQIVRGLKIILRDAGYGVESAETKAQALAMLGSRPPDALVLDLVLPDGSGVEVCQEVRRFSGLPILVLSAIGDEREKVRALDAGADDYVTKPFGTNELLARLRAVMRRSADPGGGSQLTIGELVIDVLDRRVTRGAEAVHLTPIEFDLVRVLAQHRGKLV